MGEVDNGTFSVQGATIRFPYVALVCDVYAMLQAVVCVWAQVGKSYEIHYVHSSAGTDVDPTDAINADLLADGLGGSG